jgi:hypothetical protein
MAKKRAPIEQLRQAGKVAQEILVKKGVHTKDSSIDKISKEVPLPGIPGYLPHAWMIEQSRRIMRDFVVLWKEECKDTPSRKNNITEFWKFCVSEMHKIEHKYNVEVVAQPKLFAQMKKVPVIADIFRPLRGKETVQAVNRFLVDTFALYIALFGQEQTVSEYLDWYADWTKKLEKYWLKSKP